MDYKRGMFLGLLLGELGYDENFCFNENLSTFPSLGMKTCYSLIDFLEKNEYDPEKLLDIYWEIISPLDSTSALSEFNELFGIDPFQYYEDYPRVEYEKETGVYQRATYLATINNLDMLIMDTHLTDPYVDKFTDIYLYTSVLRLLLIQTNVELILNQFKGKFIGSVGEAIYDTLTGKNKLNSSFKPKTRDLGCIIGAVYGAMHGYQKMCMEDRVIYYSSLHLDFNVFQVPQLLVE